MAGATGFAANAVTFAATTATVALTAASPASSRPLLPQRHRCPHTAVVAAAASKEGLPRKRPRRPWLLR